VWSVAFVRLQPSAAGAALYRRADERVLVAVAAIERSEGPEIQPAAQLPSLLALSMLVSGERPR